MDELDEFVFSMVLNNEVTCRLLVKDLQARGVTFSVPPEKLSHDDLIRAVRILMKDLKEREQQQVFH